MKSILTKQGTFRRLHLLAEQTSTKKEAGDGSTIPCGTLKIGPTVNRMATNRKIVSNFSEQRMEFGMIFRVRHRQTRKRHRFARLV
jgi:hypothetical protein